MSAELFCKIKALLLIATLAGAEVQQVNHNLRLARGPSSESLESLVSASGASGAGKSDVLGNLQAMMSQQQGMIGSFAKQMERLQGQAAFFGEELNKMMADPNLQEQGASLAAQMEKVMNDPALKERTKAVAEQIKSAMAGPNPMKQIQSVVEQVQAIISDPSLHQQGMRVEEQLKEMVDDPKVQGYVKAMTKHAEAMKPDPETLQQEQRTIEEMEKMIADSKIQEKAQQFGEQLKTLMAEGGADSTNQAKDITEELKRFAEQMHTAMPDIDIVKTGSISQDFAEQMKALVPNSNFEEQAKDVAQQIEAMTASPSSATQARLAAEQMEAFMANPGFQEHAAQFAEQMEAADPKLREQIAEKVEAMMANPTFRQQVQRVAARMDREEAYSESAEQAKLVAEQMEAMGVDLNLQDADTNTVNDGLVDRMVESLFDRAIDTAPRQQVDMDGATLGKTEQRPRRLEEMKKMAQVDASKSSGNSVAGTTANVVKAIVGAGILSLSWSYYYATMLPSLFFTLVMGFFCAMNYFFLGLVADKLDMGSYTDIWIKSFGAKAGILSDIVISLACFANLASYLIVGGDYLPIALKGLGVSWPFLQDRSHAIALVWLLILPLNFLKDLSILGYTSIVGTLGAVYTTGMLLVEGIKAGFSTSDWKMFSFTPGWFIMIPAVAFAFNGHFNAPSVYRQLADRSPSRWAKVTTISFSICTVVTLICGVSGYLMFGSGLGLPGRSNVLTAPAFKGMLAAMVAYLATTLSVSLGYPLNSQALRNCFDSLLTNYMPDAVSSALKKMNNDVRLNVVSAVLVSLSLLVALSTDNLGVLNSINGAVGGCLMIFVMPSMMYLKTLESEKGVSALQKALPMASIATGGVIGVVGTLTALLAAAGVKLA